MKKKALSLLLSTAVISQLIACGTILHPERKGTISGRLDPAIVALDAIGLLFFFVPGVIAFAVDFTNGTIYLPNSKPVQLSDQELKTLHSNGKLKIESLKEALAPYIQTIAPLDSASLSIQAANSEQSLAVLFQLHRSSSTLAVK